MFQHYAVIGNPVSHSLSPVIHHYFAEQTDIELRYEKIKGDDHIFEQQVVEFFANHGKGLNVTLPYKQRAFAMAEVQTSRCRLAGAANTLWMKENQLHADNTDGIGLIRDLTRYMILQDKNILILGAGGAARGIIYPLLEQKPAALSLCNRTLEKAKELQAEFSQIHCIELNKLSGQFDLIINATSASLEGTSLILPAEITEQKPFCYDLAYKQKEMTPFVQYAKSIGCDAVDGLGMLVEQAAEAFKIWNEVMPQTGPVLKLLRQP